MKKIKEFKPLIKFIKEDKYKLIIASFLCVLSGLNDILAGYLNGSVVEFITKMNLKMAIIYLLIYLVLELTVSGFILHIANSMLYKFECRLSRKLSYFTYKKSLNLPAEAFEKHSSGEIINRITSDSDTLSNTFGYIVELFVAIVGAIIIMVYVFINSWIIALEIIFILLILFIVIKKYNPLLKDVHKEIKKEPDKFTSLTNESIRGIREIKTLGIKKSLISNIQDLMKLIYKKSEKEIDLRKKFNIITRFLKTLLEVGVFFTCVILLYYGKINLTFFIAMTYYVYRYMWLIENINYLYQTLQKTSVAISRVNEILSNKLYEDVKFGDKKIKDAKGIIEFKNVEFSYPNEENTLNKFNLKIVPNKKIAVVGKSGQGKSTLFNLITRIFDVNGGQILIDGVDIKDLTEQELRKNISIIRQEPFIFNASIKDNFKLVNKNITLKEIRKYSKMAYIDDYIMSLPKKYNTVLGEGGVNLSGGQKQRLSIARTLCKQSKKILFDEATSALDNESQEFIKKAIDNLVNDHTVVIVAHRLSTIIDADIIYVVERGKVVASGTHKELLKQNQIYKNLYTNESLNSKEKGIK